jgi:hypothetical protein
MCTLEGQDGMSGEVRRTEALSVDANGRVGHARRLMLAALGADRLANLGLDCGRQAGSW